MKLALPLLTGTALGLSLCCGNAELVPCDPHSSCPSKNTCCKHDDGSFTCVPSEAGIGDAVCCEGGGLACPANYTCSPFGSLKNACVSPSGPQHDPMLSEDWPYPMGMAGWNLAYNACPAFGPHPPRYELNIEDKHTRATSKSSGFGLQFPCVQKSHNHLRD